MANYASYPSLHNRTIFISGGASGIGAAIVTHFCAQGAKAAFVDIDAAAGANLTAQIEKTYGQAPLFIPCDLRDIVALRAAIAQTEKKFGAIRALVNNAARDDRHNIESVTPEFWDQSMAVNLRHQFFATQAVAPGMKAAGGGSIINMGSISWMTRTGGMPAYTTAKAAVQGLTRGLARDLGPYNIRVNTVVPGWVMTQRQLTLWVDDAGNETMDREQCLKGRIPPDDLARMVLFLAADDSRMCSAQDFIVDAGWA